METKEYAFKGMVVNGFLMLFVNIAVAILSIVGIVYSIILLDSSNGACGGWLLAAVSCCSSSTSSCGAD